MKPMLDAKCDLAGATPETLARALFPRVEEPGPARQSVVGDEGRERRLTLSTYRGALQSGLAAAAHA